MAILKCINNIKIILNNQQILASLKSINELNKFEKQRNPSFFELYN